MIKKIGSRVLAKLGYVVQKKPKAYVVAEREAAERSKTIIKKISPDLKILNGPFKGLKYPDLVITESALAPKIVGSYESQLHEFTREIFEKKYDNIIDVGCAEGYYAVGFANNMPNSTVHGFDINERDLDFCQRYANANGVDNLKLHKFCSPETLISFDFGRSGLVFCDCEGYEVDLFTPEVIKALNAKNVDVLVELHDVCRDGVTSTLITRFKDTHDFRFTSTHCASEKDWDGLKCLPPEDKKFAILEHRGGVYQNIYMEWVYFTKKQYPKQI